MRLHPFINVDIHSDGEVTLGNHRYLTIHKFGFIGVKYSLQEKYTVRTLLPSSNPKSQVPT